MQTALRQHLRRLCVGVAVFAEMPTGVVGPNIAGKITGAFRPRAFLFRYVQPLPDGLFIVADAHTASAVGAVRSELISLGAGLHSHAVGRRDADHLPAQEEPLILRHRPDFRKIAPHLGVQVDKTDNRSLRISIQGGGNLFKCPQMILR